MRFLRSTLEIARQTLCLLLQHRLLWIVALAEIGLGMLAWFIARDPPHHLAGASLFIFLAYWLLLFVLTPWTAMFFGVHVVHGDVEDRTFQFLFLRPIPRAAILLGKWLGVSLLCSLLLVVGALLLFGALALQRDSWNDGIEWRLLPVFTLAVAGAATSYAAMAVWFGAFFRRPLVWGAFLIVGVQTFVSFLPAKASLRAISILDAVRHIVYEGIDPTPRLANMLWPAENKIDVIGHPWLQLLVIVGVCLLLALWSYCRTEYDSRERE
jgi:ABC-type transport system involved in multi-copper enzyme maturation permease subunit